MNTAELFAQKTVFSFEIYPAKKTAPIEVVYQAVDALSRLAPDYISVTYGAGGGAANAAATVEIASLVKNTYGIEAVAHLPGINLTHADVASLLPRLQAHGIENILALRGDRSAEDEKPTGEFVHASDLVSFIKEQTGNTFNIIGACYPEVHTEAPDAATDLAHLKTKVEVGVTQLITQLFFDNDAFYRFRDDIRAADITVPLQAGIMPLASARQAAHILKLCQPSQPPALKALFERYGDNATAFYEAALDYAIEQIADLIKNGVDGIHLYTMNNPQTAEAITSAIYPLLAK